MSSLNILRYGVSPVRIVLINCSVVQAFAPARFGPTRSSPRGTARQVIAMAEGAVEDVCQVFATGEARSRFDVRGRADVRHVLDR